MATSNPKIQIEVAVDASGVTEGVNQAKRDIASLPQELQAQADKTATAFKKTEEAAKSSGKSFREAFKEQAAAAKEVEQAAAKAEKTQRTFAAQLQRNQNEFIKQTQGQEALAKSLGVTDAAVLAQARAFDEQRAALQRGGRELDKFGNTAKQTAAALRQVPAQFTDIVVSLQGGQAPLTVLLQQGGQLKDVFGSAGAAAQALGGYITSLINPLTLAALGIGSLAVAYQQGSKEAEAFNKTLILTGNAAGTSAAALSDIARSISATSEGITQSKAAAALNEIAAAGAVGTQNLERFTKAALEFQRAGGGAAADVGKAFADLAKDPLDASEKLNKSTNFLTAEIYNQIKALEDQGRSSEAAKVAQEAYFAMLEDRTPKLNTNLGLLERGWRGVTESAGKAWDAMLDVGRAQTLGSRLDAARNLLAEYEATPAGKRTTEQVSRVQSAGGVEGLRNQILGLEDLIATQKRADEQQRQNNQSTQAAIGLSKDAAKYDSDLAKQRKAVAQATAQYQKALEGNLSPEAVKQAEADYLKIVTGITAATKERTTATRGLSEEEKRLREERKNSADVVKTRNELVEKSYKDQIKFEQDLAKSIANTVAEREKDTAKVQEQVQRERDVAAAIGLTKEQVAELAAAKYDDAAAGLERQAIDEEMLGYSTRLVEETRKQAEAFRELAAAKRETGRKQSEFDADKEATKQAEEATKDWLKAAADIEKSITDALFRAFESGKGFVQALRDTIVNAFKTMVLKPIVQAVVSPVAGAITGALGLPGAANAATGGASMLGGLGNLGGIGSAIGGFGTAASYGAQALFAGNGLGALSGGASMIGAGSFAQGAGMIAGVVGPIVAGVALLASLIKSTKTPGEQTMGGYASTRGREATLENAMLVTGGGGWDDGAWARDLITREDAGLKTFTQRTVDGVLEAANNRAQKLGLNIALGIDAGFAANLSGQGTDKNAFGYAQVFANDKLVAEFQDRELGPDLVKAGAAFTQKLQDAVAKALLEGSGIESKEFVQFDQTTGQFVTTVETASQTLDRLANSLTLVNGTFDTLGLTLFETSLAGGDVASGLIEAFGNPENFAQAASSFYQNFFTDTERQVTGVRQLNEAFDKLGVTMPDLVTNTDGFVTNAEEARSTFRALTLAALQAGDGELAAGLLSLESVLNQLAPAAADAATAVEAVSETLRRLQGEQNTLERQLLELQGGDLRAFDTAGFTEAEIAAYDFNEALRDQIQALKDAQQAEIDRANSIRQSTVDVARIAVEAARTATEAARNAVTAALDGVRSAVESERTTARQRYDDDLAALRSSFDAQRSALQASFDTDADSLRDRISAIGEVIGTLDGALKSVQDTIANNGIAAQTAARLTLQSVLTAVRGGASVADFSDVISQSSATLTRNDPNLYGSREEFIRSQVKSTDILGQLNTQGKRQLSAAEQQLQALETGFESSIQTLDTGFTSQEQALKDGFDAEMQRLDAIVEQATAQVNAALGIKTATQSVADAVNELTSAISGLKTATEKEQSMQDSWSTVAGRQVFMSSGGAVGTKDAQGNITLTGKDGGVVSGAATIAAVNNALASNDFVSVYTNALKFGVSSTLLDDLMGWAPGTSNLWADENNLPRFARGGYYPGGLALVGEEGPEIINFSNPGAVYNASQTSAMMGNEAVVAELRSLRSEVVELRVQARRTADATNGNPEQPMLVETVA